MSEAKLCQAFRGWCEESGWIVHPEVGSPSWDLVLIQAPGFMVGNQAHPLHRLPFEISWKEGDQIGVQAKLTPGIEVLHQAAVAPGRTGPAWRLVLVPHASAEFVALAGHLGCLVAMQLRLKPSGWRGRKREWVEAEDGFFFAGSARQFPVSRQLELPPIVTDLVAGGPAPKSLTPWRVKALRLCRLLRSRGWLTRADFKAAAVDPRLWINGRWLTETAESVKVDGHVKPQRKMVPGSTPLPDVGWEQISAELAAKEQT